MKSNSYVKFSNIFLVFLSLICSDIVFAQTASTSTPVFTYVVKKDESFSIIAREYLARYSDIPTLAKFNHWTVEKKLQPGQMIQIPQDLLKIKPVAIELIAFTGNVTFKAIKNKPVMPAKLNQSLQTGDVLQTSVNSKATIRFADGSTTEMQPNSKLTLKTVGQYAGLNTYISDVQLDVGRVEVTANPQHQIGNRMHIITPFAVAAVRGTKFRVGAESAAGLEETIEGSVALDAAGTQILLDHGFGSMAEKDQAPLPPVALLAAPDVSQLNKLVKQIPVTFDMPKQAEVAVWSAQVVRPDGTIAQQILSKDNAVLALGDMPDGVYSMRVRGQDKLGLQGFDSIHQFEINARPFAPIVEANPHPFRALPKFAWNKVEGVDHYLVEVSHAENFSQKLIDLKVENNSFALNQLTPGQYYLRVASIDQAKTGAYSQTQTFVYQPLDFVPEFDRTNFDFEDVTTVKLSLPPLPATLKYYVMLTSDKERQQVIWQKVLSDTNTNFVNADFIKPPPGKYYYSIRYTDDADIRGPITTYPIQIR